jgi:hypothetical protein
MTTDADTKGAANSIAMKLSTLPPAGVAAFADLPLSVYLVLALPGLWVALESAWTYSVSQRIARKRMRIGPRP